MQSKNMNKTLGVIGAGQLGKMIGQAAANFGIKTYFYDPDPNAPARNISSLFYNDSFDNKKKLLEFTEKCDFLTYEFENIPVDVLKSINNKKRIYPSLKALQVSQDRHLEKSFISKLGIKTVEYKNVKSILEVKSFLKKNSSNGLIKTRRLGYDGKGQIKVNLKDINKIKINVSPDTFIIEKLIKFSKEISVIAIREKSGVIKTYEPSENYHKEGILRNTIFPTTLSEKCILKAKNVAKKIIKALDVVGILAVEMFVLENEEIIVNEIAPRPHNSGHWTLDGCNISQFDALVRSIYRIPIPKLIYSKKCKMINLLGENFEDYKKYIRKKNHKVYIYGKLQVRKARKMGHVNINNW